MEREDEEGLRPYIYFDTEKNNNIIQDLDGRLHGMRNCYNLMRKHGAELQQALTDFESKLGNSESTILKLSQLISEKGTLLGIAARAMLLSSDSYINSAESDVLKLIKSFQYERTRTRELENLVHDVAKEQTLLERRTKEFSRYVNVPELESHPSLVMNDDYEEQLYEKETQEATQNQLEESDSLTSIQTAFKRPSPLLLLRNKKLLDTINKEKERRKEKKREKEKKKEIEKEKGNNTVERKRESLEEQLSENVLKIRRNRVPDRPNIPFSAWSVLKNSIGKDLSKIPMPINFNEPITVLQRITEELEYSELLDLAVNIEDTCEQLAYVAAFAISVYAPTAVRTNKPFNPLLGETYECDRMNDLGWRSISEQVSHHPPISVLHCEGRGWTFWQELSMITKFRGKSIQVRPTGHCNCKFEKTGNTYKWNKPITMVHNIIFGKMWMDQQGQVNIVGLETAAGVKCEINFVPLSYFSSETVRQVNGSVKDKNDIKRWLIKGVWDEKVEIASITEVENANHEISYVTNEFKLIWKRNERDADSENYHNFSKFTCELNELEPGVSPTDSRLRPDVRLMEEGFWDESNAEKLRLEQKQRDKRKRSSAGTSVRPTFFQELYEPIWFKREIVGDKHIYTYKGTYWDAKEKQNWSQCPDIF